MIPPKNRNGVDSMKSLWIYTDLYYFFFSFSQVRKTQALRHKSNNKKRLTDCLKYTIKTPSFRKRSAEKKKNMNIPRCLCCPIDRLEFFPSSGSLGEREMLWEHEPKASVSTAFSSSPKLSRLFLLNN